MLLFHRLECILGVQFGRGWNVHLCVRVTACMCVVTPFSGQVNLHARTVEIHRELVIRELSCFAFFGNMFK